MTDHANCCCTETLTDLGTLKAAYWSTSQALAATDGRLHETVAERDRARSTAARLEEELARGFRTAAPDITLSRDDGPTTPDNLESVDGIVQIRPGSEITSADTCPPENAPESRMGALIPTEPSNNGRSGRRLPIQDAPVIPTPVVGPCDVEHLYIWGHDEPICTIVTPRDET